jgi:uncharacterized membrane protein YphA (DoxX/SURF4 family)
MAWKTAGAGRMTGVPGGTPFVVLRVSLGLFMIAKGLGKLQWFVHPEILTVRLHAFLERATPLNRWWVALLLPGATVFARLVPFGELAGGSAMILGRFARLAALLAFLMILNFHLATGELFRSEFFTDGQAFPVLGGLLAIALAGRRS